MGTEVLKSFDSLQEELEKAKNNLKGLNDNIRRIIGRDPVDIHLRGDRKRSFNESRRNDFNSDRQKNRELSPISNKRRPQEAKSVFSRLSGPPSRDDDLKPKIHSRVIRELPTRQEIVAAQGTDEESRARNKRMFGSLLGTLQKFCQEESRLKPKEEKKAQIEKKLEEQEIKERENLRKERQSLFSDRKRQQLEIRKLELKMTRLKEFEIWEKTKNNLRNFIITKTKPHIYFNPKLKNDKLEKRLAECRIELEQEIEQKRAALNDEIQDIENRFKYQEEKYLDKDNHSENSKHNRRNENNDDEDEHDSIYENSDDDADMDRLQNKNNNEQKNFNENERENDENDENHNDDNEKNENSLDNTNAEIEQDTPMNSAEEPSDKKE